MKDEKKKTPSEWTVMIGKTPKKVSSFEEAVLFADTSDIKGTRAVDFTNLRIIVIPSIDRTKRDLAS